MSRIHSSWVLVGCSSALMRGTDSDLAVWLAEHGLLAQRLDGGLAALHVLRQHARTATEALATGRMPTAADLDALNAALGAPPGRLVLVDAETPRPQLAFQTDADDAVLTAFRVALSFATFSSQAIDSASSCVPIPAVDSRLRIPRSMAPAGGATCATAAIASRHVPFADAD